MNMDRNTMSHFCNRVKGSVLVPVPEYGSAEPR